MTPRDEIERCARALLSAADAINEGFDPFTSMNCVCSEEAQERCASPVAPEDAPCSTCRHRKLKLQAAALRSALSRPAPATEAKCPRCGSDDRRMFGVESCHARGIHDPWHDATPRAGASEGEGVRDSLGRRVRELWVAWASRQPAPKPSWLVPYDDLCEADKEADRCIGAALWGDGFRDGIESAYARPTPPPAEVVEAKEYRVVWKRVGLPRKLKRYATLRAAERFVVFIGPEPWKALGRDPDALHCCRGRREDECACGGKTWREHLLDARTFYDGGEEGPEKRTYAPIEYVRIEQRPVGEWRAAEAAERAERETGGGA